MLCLIVQDMVIARKTSNLTPNTMKQKYFPPNVWLQFSLSKCCNAKVLSIPACFGDPSITLCDKCMKDCERVWRPLYEKVGTGTYRRIEYPEFEEVIKTLK